jgi:hypothetical protein
MINQSFPENSASFLTGLFKNPRNAENIYNELLKKGHQRENITLIMSDDTQRKYFSDVKSAQGTVGSKALEGAAIGGAVGGALGGIATAVAAVGSALVIPALGLVVAGSLAASFAGAGAGAAAGGILGALVGAGIPRVEAEEYEKGIREGGVVIGVTPLTSDDYMLLQEAEAPYPD